MKWPGLMVNRSAVVHEYLKGVKMSRITNKYDVSRTMVRKYLKKAGIGLRLPHRTKGKP